MKTKWLLLPLLLLIVSACSGTQPIIAEKPTRTSNVDMAYKTTTSFISMPLEISLREIEQQLNKSLNGLIYEDTNLEDDKTEMKIWKTAAIQLEEKNGKIQSIIPLKIWAKLKYGTDFLGLNDTREINLNGTITLLSDARLSNWTMNTQSTIEDVVWNESPTLQIAGKNVPITYIINPTLSLFKAKVAQKIDAAINKSCDFKPYVLDVLETLSKPLLTSEAYQAWFKLIPMEVYVTDAVLDKTKIAMNLGLKCGMTTIVGQQPKSGMDRNAISFKAAAKLPERTTASIAAITTYENASQLISQNFKGQEFTSGNRKIKVEKVALWGKDGRMIIALDLSGSITGTIYLSGIPKYDPVNKEIYFENLDYVLNTKGLLTKAANWLLQGYILRKIQESCRYSIRPNMEEGKKNLLYYLSNFSPMKGVFINGSIGELEFEKIELTNDLIIAFINGNGKMNVKIDGMD
jgi:hypothetical protein